MAMSIVLALVLLALSGLAAWYLLRHGTSLLPNGWHRIAAPAVAALGVLAAVLALLLGSEAEPEDVFKVSVEPNRGAVSYPFLVEQAGVAQEIVVWPQSEPGKAPEPGLEMRVILSGPAGKSLLNESVRFAIEEVDIARADGTRVRGPDWVAWSREFVPRESGFYEIALGMPAGAPRIEVRIGTPAGP